MRFIKRKKSYIETMHPILVAKNRWLYDVLFNEVYQKEPKLWTWLKEKLDEYQTKVW